MRSGISFHKKTPFQNSRELVSFSFNVSPPQYWGNMKQRLEGGVMGNFLNVKQW
jgi:hypothetical protein